MVGDERPDLTLILDLPAEQGLERAARRRGARDVADRFESEGVAFHRRLRDAFREIAREEPERCAIIDASRAEDEVAGQIWERRDASASASSCPREPRRHEQGRSRDPAKRRLSERAPHPRMVASLVGHRAAEAEMLGAYREGRLAHAWLIGGKEGVGKATLAWRFARFVLANPDPKARAVREAVDLSVPESHPSARHLAAMAHPDFALLRREWNPKSKNFFTEIRVEDIRNGMQVFHLSAAFGGWRVAIVDSADDLNTRERQCAFEDDRGAAAARADPDRRAPAGAGAADHPLALPAPVAGAADAGRDRGGRARAGLAMERGRPRQDRRGRRRAPTDRCAKPCAVSIPKGRGCMR